MAKFLKCNSCGGRYPDTRNGKTASYLHVCPPDTENPRNENLKPHPDKPEKLVLVSEGSGATEVE